LTTVDDAVLALLHLTRFIEGKGEFAVAGEGFISDPKNKNKSVAFTDWG
jgi:hypothetical protein